MQYASKVLMMVKYPFILETVYKYSIEIILGIDDAISMGYR